MNDMWITAINEHIKNWTQGRMWFPRACVIALMMYYVVRQFHDGFYATPLSALDLGIHEAGHLVTKFFGQFICVAAGSGLQIIAPIIAAIVFIRQSDWFAVSFSLYWLGVSIGEVGVYAGDAVTQSLPLVNVGGGDAYHDWGWMLETLGMLGWTDAIAGFFYVFAVLFQTAGLVSGVWITWLIWSLRRRV